MRRFPAPLEWTGYFKENTVDDRVVRPGYVRRPRLYMFTLNTHRWLLIVNNICKVIYLRIIWANSNNSCYITECPNTQSLGD